MQQLKGLKAIVTGSSRGIGAAVAQAFADQGAQVAISYSRSAEQAQTLKDSLPGEGHFIGVLNVADPESVESYFSGLLKEWGNADVLVNNAGITKDQLLLRMKNADFSEVIDTNLKGAFYCTKQVLKGMIKNKSGSIINISSVVAQSGNPGQANYVASKAGLEGFTRSIALEVASRGVRANCVAPGFIETEMTGALDAKQKESILAKIPLNQMGSVQDIAEACIFLASPKSGYITGQTLQVNGGMYL